MADPTGPGVVEGTENDDVIDSSYTDGDGDSVTSGADLVYGEGGSDTIEGGDGDDTIFGGSGQDTTEATRESFNWSDLADRCGGSLSDGEDIRGGQTQNTGTVDVTFTIVDEHGVDTEFEKDSQNISGIDGGSETINAKSSLESETNRDGETATYRLDFSETVSNVDFRVNDIDHDSVVNIVAYDAEGNQIPVTLTASGSTDLNLSDTDSVAGDDTATATGNSGPNTGNDNSILVEIAGPVARIEITHSNDGGDDSNVNITDVFFDAGTESGEDEGDLIFGGGGDDLIFGQEGADTIDGGDGNDTIYGGNGGEGTTTTSREIFEWSEGPGFYNGKDVPNFTQDTGSANITFSTTATTGYPDTEYETTTQVTSDLDPEVGEKSSLSSDLNHDYESATYQWTSDKPLENVEFRINDIDGDGRVVVRAYDANNTPIEVILSDAGSGLSLSDSDGVPGNDTAASIDRNYTSDDNPEHSVLVTIEGPVSRWEVVHEQDGYYDSGINITDIAFDVPVVTGGGTGDDVGDSLFGGAGNDVIYGEGGNDTIDGGTGNDTLFGGEGDDTIYGGAGDDVIGGSTGPTTTTGPELLSNGSFEDGHHSANTVSGLDNWSTVTGSPDAADDGTGSEYWNPSLDATDGTGYVTMWSYTDRPQEAISQTLDAPLEEGQDYTLTFNAQSTDWESGQWFTPQDIPVNFEILDQNGNLLGSTIVQGTDYEPYEISFTAPAGVTGIQLRPNGSDDPTATYPAVTLDEVSLVAVTTEPGAGDEPGNDLIDGEDGDDTIFAGTGDDTIYGGDGSDSIEGGDGDDYIDSSSGDPVDLPDLGFPSYMGFPAVPADSDPNNDKDFVDGGAGNDTIITGDDDDTIFGGSGDDLIDGGVDKDLIYGGTGDDTIIGGEGNDTIDGGDGDDLIYGGLDPAFPDYLNIPNDGSVGDPDPELENGRDLIFGGAGDDTIFGQDDDDTIYGGSGDDYLDGGVDDDLIYGGDGDDTIIGGQGADTMFGGDGNDTFFVSDASHADGDVISGGSGPDDTTDWDVLDLTGSGSRTINATADANDAGALTGTVTFENGEVLTFSGIEEIICFTPGTAILTPSGEVAVENLKVGDKVVTRDNGLQTIRWVGKKQLSGRDLLSRPKLRPVMIRAGSLGPNLPDRDMMVSPNHRMLLVSEQAQLLFNETEVLVAAKHLVGMDGVQQVDRVGVEYVHFLCDNHEVVLANGAWSESFQPGAYSMGAIDQAQREEIYDLFPELRNTETLEDFSAARLTLKRHEANLLVSS